MGKTMLRLLCILPVVAILSWSTMASAEDKAPLNEREHQLMGIAASCVAFYQSAMAELELPIEGNEAKRQAYLAVFEALGKRGRSHKEYEAAFQRDVVMRTIEVTTIIENDPTAARHQVLGNLPKCDAYLEEMKTAAGLS
ncbi:MAG: hypothetical protein P1U88_08130 [Thalassobaculaceae bacterium]|nr:hypothetical protein [Thalassobaculaceae bacterium]